MSEYMGTTKTGTGRHKVQIVDSSLRDRRNRELPAGPLSLAIYGIFVRP